MAWGCDQEAAQPSQRPGGPCCAHCPGIGPRLPGDESAGESAACRVRNTGGGDCSPETTTRMRTGDADHSTHGTHVTSFRPRRDFALSCIRSPTGR